jgi:hypothetical protein
MKTLKNTLLFSLLIAFCFSACKTNKPKPQPEPEPDKKPVIYLYPEKEEDVSVKLEFKGKITCTYPEYQEGWKVKAKPDGTLLNYNDNREYSYLFWEGVDDYKWDFTKLSGFIVKGEDTRSFLQNTLSNLGLTSKEYNEFIVYWLPQMQKNKFNFIHFAAEEYTTRAKLTIEPKPDVILRVFMVYMPLEKEILIPKQEIKSVERHGFTVVEWGGCAVKTDSAVYKNTSERVIKENDLEGEMFSKWMKIKDDWRLNWFQSCLAKNKKRLTCDGCESIYITVNMKIDANGKLLSYTKIKSYMCGEDITPKLEKCFMDYFFNFTFPEEFRNCTFEVQLGEGLKC